MKVSFALKFFRWLVVGSILIVTVHVVLNFISIVVFDQKHAFLFELSNRFDLNDENSVPQWFTQAIFLGISLLAFLSYRLTHKKEGAKLWLLVSVLGLLMSIDDVATLHEFVLLNLHNTFFLDQESTTLVNAWLIILPFVILGLIFLIRWAVNVLPARTALLIGFSSVVYIVGAVIIDSLANHYHVESFMAQGVMGGIEGGLQLIGSGGLLYAIMDYLERYYSKPIASALSHIKPAKR